ncbi:2,4-dichlorophenol 6-monooxygenase [Sphingobium xenophagum]|uniref:2,4-dichlorophenol 6-monooxygenase n=2 Tax=Sphingobium xenophagum TaxID=121428 RepID=A0ABU1X368_SPHXE|nr:2,4-dichlorophenol 6-monooxygenase [Sphingobium xenophagum]
MSDRNSVLIVGAGPTGLSAAIMLRLRGYDPVVLDRRAGLANLPAAHVLNTRSCEVLAEMGAVDAAIAAGEPLSASDSGLVVWTESLSHREYGRLHVPAAPDDDRGPLSAFGSLNIAPNRLEALLYDRLVSLGGTVSFGEQVLGVKQTKEGAEVEIRSVAEGKGRKEAYGWVIGCDGAGSIVRKSIGIEMEGPRTLARFMTIYFRADLDHFVEGRRAILYWVGGKDVRGVLINFEKATGTWAMLVPIADLPMETFDADASRRILHKAIGSEDVAIDIFAVSDWNMSAQVATAYRAGHVLLAGDACHRFPPTGGLGMNTGIQDAHNLVWKLSAVIEQRAPATLLDSYEQERRPIAQRNTDQSVRNLMKMGMIDEALGIATLAPVLSDAGIGPIDSYPSGALRIDEGHAEAATHRAAVQHAIDAQAEHFAQGAGMDLGFSYTTGALIPDGSPPPSTDTLSYRPDAHPGARLPYAAVSGRFEDSTLGHILSEGVTLFAADDRWSAIAREVSIDTGVPIHAVAADAARFGERIKDLLGIGPGGVVAVRPDGHVLWRSAKWLEGGLAELRHAVQVSHGRGVDADFIAGTGKITAGAQQDI